MSASAAKQPGRFDALDTLRCLAVLVMVQGHTFYLVVEDSLRSSAWYGWHNYLHGFTAPAFLFGAGLAFGVTTLRDFDSHAQVGPTLYKRLYRYLGLFAIGYFMQMPPLHLDMTGVSAAHVRVFFRVEALQHIAVGLLVCQALVLLLRDRFNFIATVTVLGVAIVTAGPYLSRLPFEAVLPLGLSAYLTTNTGSTFPLLPWAGFVFMGVTTAAAIQSRAMTGPSRGLVASLCGAGLALVGLSLAFDLAWPAIWGDHNYWKVSPYFFLRRFGWVVVLLGAFAAGDLLWSRMGAHGGPGPVRRMVRLVSQNSLILYVAHLWVLYGSQFGDARGAMLHSLDLVQASALVFGLLAALVLMLYGWRFVERNWEKPFLVVRRGVVASMAAAVVFCMVQVSGLHGIEAAPPMAKADTPHPVEPMAVPVVEPVVEAIQASAEATASELMPGEPTALAVE